MVERERKDGRHSVKSRAEDDTTQESSTSRAKLWIEEQLVDCVSSVLNYAVGQCQIECVQERRMKDVQLLNQVRWVLPFYAGH